MSGNVMSVDQTMPHVVVIHLLFHDVLLNKVSRL
jgi:hypothetical protein